MQGLNSDVPPPNHHDVEAGAHHHHLHLPHLHKHPPRTHRLPKGIHPAGESNRKGIHPFHFLRICGRSSSHLSMAVNVLWPFVPAAIAVYYLLEQPSHSVTIFALNFLAIIPTANLIGFAGQELARKLPLVFGKRQQITRCMVLIKI